MRAPLGFSKVVVALTLSSTAWAADPSLDVAYSPLDMDSAYAGGSWVQRVSLSLLRFEPLIGEVAFFGNMEGFDLSRSLPSPATYGARLAVGEQATVWSILTPGGTALAAKARGLLGYEYYARGANCPPYQLGCIPLQPFTGSAVTATAAGELAMQFARGVETGVRVEAGALFFPGQRGWWTGNEGRALGGVWLPDLRLSFVAAF